MLSARESFALLHCWALIKSRWARAGCSHGFGAEESVCSRVMCAVCAAGQLRAEAANETEPGQICWGVLERCQQTSAVVLVAECIHLGSSREL